MSTLQTGYPPKWLQAIMGHASITTTLGLYDNLYPADTDLWADRLDAPPKRRVRQNWAR